VEPANVHFAQMFDERRGSTPMRGDEDVELVEKRIVRKTGEAHR
jgi:hypothetical protein